MVVANNDPLEPLPPLQQPAWRHLPPPPPANNNRSQHLDEYFDSLPRGYRFYPTDEELMNYYLRPKIQNSRLPPNRIMDVVLYRHNPYDLAEKYRKYGEKEWYFFTPRDRKYKNGDRPNRAAGDGYWKATGADKKIKSRGSTVGLKKSLVFYKGKPPKGEKTNWIMHEYRVPPDSHFFNSKKGTSDMQLDEWVLCKIYEKLEKSKARKINDKSSSLPIPNHDYGDDHNESIFITEPCHYPTMEPYQEQEEVKSNFSAGVFPPPESQSDNGFFYEVHQFNSNPDYNYYDATHVNYNGANYARPAHCMPPTMVALPPVPVDNPQPHSSLVEELWSNDGVGDLSFMSNVESKIYPEYKYPHQRI